MGSEADVTGTDRNANAGAFKEVKGNARKLSDMQGRHAKEAKFKSRELNKG